MFALAMAGCSAEDEERALVLAVGMLADDVRDAWHEALRADEDPAAIGQVEASWERSWSGRLSLDVAAGASLTGACWDEECTDLWTVVATLHDVRIRHGGLARKYDEADCDAGWGPCDADAGWDFNPPNFPVEGTLELAVGQRDRESDNRFWRLEGTASLDAGGWVGRVEDVGLVVDSVFGEYGHSEEVTGTVAGRTYAYDHHSSD